MLTKSTYYHITHVDGVLVVEIAPLSSSLPDSLALTHSRLMDYFIFQKHQNHGCELRRAALISAGGGFDIFY